MPVRGGGSGGGRKTGPRNVVTLNPGANIQAAIDANPGETTFYLASGTYTGQSFLTPKSGNVFDGGNRGATLDLAGQPGRCFYSDTAQNVTIRGLVIKRYASALQAGAIHMDAGAAGWLIENCHVTLNAAVGVCTDSGTRVRNCLLDHNGQSGFSAHGGDILYEGNEIAYNNTNLVVDITWEAGGGKTWDTRDAIFRGNNVHDNGGHGLWDDTNNIRITYDGNTVTNNTCSGIYHEIGYEATIVNNTISGNGMPASPGGGEQLGWMWDAGIQIRCSRPVNSGSPILIRNNTVTGNYNGIALIDSPPEGASGVGEQAYGTLYLADTLVDSNTIGMTRGASGVVQDGRGSGVFAQNLVWTNNDYTVGLTHEGGDVYNWLAWADAYSGWATWQGLGHDATGSFISS